MSVAIAELSQGEHISGSYLLLKVQINTARNGKAYGALTLGDRSGQVEAKLWDDADALLGPLQAGQVVRVSAKVDAYQGRDQLVLNDIAPDENAMPGDFLPASPKDPEELWKAIDKARAKVKNKFLKKLLKAFFDDPAFLAEFGQAPAAKGAHHAYVHGLLEHTSGVASLAVAISGQYPDMDADLLISGALLHDIGKTRELTLGPPMDFTDAGRLEGHIVIGVRMLDEKLAAIKDIPKAAAEMLRHLILSHHGALEFGSPVKPMTAEAFALNMVDDLDAKLAMIGQSAGEPDGGGNWSRYNRLLERVIYAGPPVWDDSPEAGPDIAQAEAKPAPPGLFDRGD